MGQYTDSITQLFQYTFKVLPEVRRLSAGIADRKKHCMSRKESQAAVYPETAAAGKLGTDVLSSSIFALYPGADMKSTLSFILTLYSLSDMLGIYRSKTGTTDESEVRKLYSCLSGAVDPSRSTVCSLAYASKTAAGQKRETQIPCLCDQCRLQLAVLPSFPLVAPKLKKYIQLYIDLQSYRYYPAIIRAEHLETWSSFYLKRYNEISCWEFCAASDSLLGVIAMYASAANPNLTQEDIRLLDEACFPWLCGLDSLLHAYVDARTSSNTESLNFTAFYHDLKACEERLSFFMAKAEEACMKLKENSFYASLIRLLIGMYLSDPEASFGMYRLASMNILKNSPPRTFLYSNACKLLNLYNL